MLSLSLSTVEVFFYIGSFVFFEFGMLDIGSGMG